MRDKLANGRMDGPPEQKRKKEPATPEQKRKLAMLLLVTAGIIAAAFYMTALLAKSHGKWKNAVWFLNGEQKFTLRALLLSMASGVVFGLVDNGGLFFGMDALEPFLPEGELTRAGWGSTYSNAVAAFLGAFAAKAIHLTFGFSGGPIYGDAVGLVIGCIIGIYVCRALTGRS